MRGKLLPPHGLLIPISTITDRVVHTTAFVTPVVEQWLEREIQTKEVKDRNRPRQPRKTSPQEDRPLLWLVRRLPFSSSMILRGNWIPNRAISMRLVRNRLKLVVPSQEAHQMSPFWHQHTKQHVWWGVRYATDGILHHGDRFIGLMKTTFYFCSGLMDEIICGGNQILSMPPATFRKPFNLVVVL